MAAYKPWLQEGQDYGYKFGNSGIIVSGLSGNLSVSITLAEDFPTLPNSYHFLLTEGVTQQLMGVLIIQQPILTIAMVGRLTLIRQVLLI